MQTPQETLGETALEDVDDVFEAVVRDDGCEKDETQDEQEGYAVDIDVEIDDAEELRAERRPLATDGAVDDNLGRVIDEELDRVGRNDQGQQEYLPARAVAQHIAEHVAVEPFGHAFAPEPLASWPLTGGPPRSSPVPPNAGQRSPAYVFKA